MNWRRVFLGGLLCWFVANALWAGLFYLLLQDDWKAALEALNRPVEQNPATAALWLVLSLAVGILAIWLYAAIRPHYGPGPKTAACAAFAVWFFGNFAPMAWLGLGLKLFHARLVAIHVVTTLVILVVATILGAWQYKEE